MDRRKFLTVLAGAAGAAAVTAVAGSAEAAEAALGTPAPTAAGFYNKLRDLPAEDAKDAQYYYYRRRRYRVRRCWLRRTYYGWRRVCRWV
jgi:hypothetical protein